MAQQQLKVLNYKRGNCKMQLTLFEKYVIKFENEEVSETNLQNLFERFNKVEPVYDNFNEVQSEIELYQAEGDIENEYVERESFQDKYFNVISHAKNILTKNNMFSKEEVVSNHNTDISVGASNAYTPRQTSIKLPVINLPTFNGTFTLWREFYDAFNSLIHQNVDLTNVQKLTYLRASLKGEPSGLINSLETTDQNYAIAWSMLQKRYNNKRRIISNHVQALLEIQSMPRESHLSLRQLINSTQNHVQCLKSLGQPVDSWNAILVPIITSKLDVQTIKDWEAKLNNEAGCTEIMPTLDDFLNFLNSRQNTLETIAFRKTGDQTKNNSGQVGYRATTKTFSTVNVVCTYCKQNHSIQYCEAFMKLDNVSRNNKVRELKICINCLRKGHFLPNCLSKVSCYKCNKRHHTLLHLSNNENISQRTISPKYQQGGHSEGNVVNSISKPVENNKSDQQPELVINCTSALTDSQVLLSTAKVKTIDKYNKIHELRVLLDSASQSNYITEQMCNQLKLNKETINMNVTGINQSIARITHKVQIEIKSTVNDFTTSLTCLVLPTITNSLPIQSINVKLLTIPPNIKLADSTFFKSGQIDMLIGASIFYKLLCVGQINNSNQPTFQKTKLGWVISGSLTNIGETQKTITCLSLNQLHKQVEKFWHVDEFILNSNILTTDDKYCEDHFTQNTSRDKNGKFIVKIPFKENLNELGDSRSVAESRFFALENRLIKNSNIKTMYTDFINEYAALNHMSKINVNNEPSFFLPHHPVVKETSETTKLRVVFDGSCKLNYGLNINETQYAGPTIQDDIFSIIARFRTYTFVLTADIEKMYRQVWIHPDHTQFQKILWRDEPHDELQCYELKTVTYGTTSAPFLAIRCLMQLAFENEVEYPIESQIIKRDFYVDDLLTGANSIDELNVIKDNLNKILQSGGFYLRKWTSNSDHLNISKTEVISIGEKQNKTLGVYWDPNADLFSYSSIKLSRPIQITKRTMLAATAQLYDPLGLIAPIIILAKLLIQELWQLNVNWDESIPVDIQTKWRLFQEQLKYINNIKIPRHVIIKNSIYIEVHSFSDACERGYGACVYLRSMNNSGEIIVTLLAAKSRVSPIKNVTLPRLELCAAVLAVQLSHKFKAILNLEIQKEYYWSDSQIVLAWLNSPSNKWKTYVANRVSEIQNLSDSTNWHHVRSADNPADLISRGVFPRQLIDSRLWWQGPQWLSQSVDNWPKSSIETSVHDLQESRKQVQTFATINIHESFPIQNYSSIERLKRIVALCLRFKNNCLLSKNNRIYGSLTVAEVENALNVIVKIIQGESFSRDLNNLVQDKQLHSKSKILSLAPFLDSQGIIRVGGRLKLSNFTYNQKHPILLPKDHHITKLILLTEHIKLMHAGPKLLLSTVRQQFWPICGKAMSKKIVRQCVKCFRFKAKPINPVMGDLPLQRISVAYPFHSTGVDYAGPFLLKDKLGRGNKVSKCYICLFVCFATKALHLELVSSLTTEAFVATLKRFIARRGKPLNIFSDNGTNFVGANHELIKINEFLKNNLDHIKHFISNEGITWRFIPPKSPHFGGLWEAGVRSTKHHLKRVLSNTPLIFEDFTTVLIQIEAILNSRPLTALSDDPNDTDVLTPAHFLIGRTFTNIPDPNFLDHPVNRLNRFQQLQKITQHFWQKWSKEYIHELQQRYKWKQQPIDELKLGAVVLIKEDNLPPARWQIGRILKLHTGQDNITRVVTVKCANGEFKRAANKLCILPFEGN